MKIKNLIIFLFFIDIVNLAFAQNIRPTTFDQREECVESKGVWRRFGNGCVDSCESQFGNFNFCSMALTYGCDCGKDSCSYQEKCISHQEYQQINLEKIRIKELESKEGEEIRKTQREALVNEIIKKLIDPYNIPLDNQQPQNAQNMDGSGVDNTDGRQISANNNVASFYGAKSKNIISDGNSNQVEKIYYNKKPVVQDVQFSTVMILDQPVPASEVNSSKHSLVDIVDKSIQLDVAKDNEGDKNPKNNSAIPEIFMQKIISNQKKQKSSETVENNVQPVDSSQDNQVKTDAEITDQKKIIQILPNQ